uniref:Fibrobacter succinogenes major paralogous domain-containing protein n=1 Tax=virus sp. ct5rm7 TaxID=2827298 RepID=A0A8S5RFZ0_9VIRU|nr:MAG TPA: hypothetical protein [virus sp. ct5rm7]
MTTIRFIGNAFITILLCVTLAMCSHRPAPVEYNGHTHIDLGLPSGTKWATCNLGAASPENYGDFYSWCETQPHKPMIPNERLWHENELGILRRHGAINDNNNLTAEYDAATANWGGKWRMPTKTEFEELFRMCEIEKHEDYVLFIGPNGNTLILPYAGEKEQSIFRTTYDISGGRIGHYWSASADSWHHLSCYYYALRSHKICKSYSHMGYSVRPVCD